MTTLPFSAQQSRRRAGFLIPAVNTASEWEYHAMAPPGLGVHVERIPVKQNDVSDDAATARLLAEVRSGIDASVLNVAACKPDVIALGMTAPAVYGGRAGASELMTRLDGLVEASVVLCSDAFVQALRVLQARRIAVLTPYQAANDAEVVRFFSDHGFVITEVVSVRSRSAHAIAQTPEPVVVGILQQLAASSPDAIIQVGANMSIAQLANELEQWLRIPVLSNNATTLWWAARTLGIGHTQDGWGTLWRTN